ncbi:MAG: TolC family protein [Elusimicrobiota bacterium]
MGPRTTLLTIALLGSAVAARAEDPAPRAAPLSEVAETVVSRNPALQGARSGVRAAESALREARAMSLPRLSARTSFVRGDNPLFVFGSRLDQRTAEQRDFQVASLNQPGYRTNIKSALEVGMPLFTGFELDTHRRMGKLALEDAVTLKEGAEQAKRYEAVESHLNVLLESARLKMLEERVKSAEAMAEDARKLKDKGMVLGSDFFAAEAILGKLKAQRTQAAHMLRAARTRLAVLTGTRAGELEPGGALTDRAYTLPPEEDLLAGSLRDRRDLRMAKLRTSLAETARRQAAMSLLPTVEAFAAVETATSDFSENMASRLLGVRASLPFGDPGYLPRKERAEARVQASRSMAEERAETVRIELTGAREAYEGAAANVPTVRWTLEQARKSLELFRPLYREGRQSVMEVLRAEDALTQAEDAYLRTLFHLHTGYARLMLAAGALEPRVVSEMESRLEAAR